MREHGENERVWERERMRDKDNEVEREREWEWERKSEIESNNENERRIDRESQRYLVWKILIHVDKVFYYFYYIYKVS